MFSKDIGIDLGTANVLIHVKGQGIVLNEPSVVVIDRNSNKVLAVGKEARKMVGRTPSNIDVIRPLKDGVIADFDVTEIMLKYFLDRLKVKGFMTKPRILICCPTNITSVEKEAIREVAEKSGARKVFIEEEPKVAAIGAGMDIYRPFANMIVDIGGGTSDIAILSLGDIVKSESIKVAGDIFDREIFQYIKRQHKIVIGEQTAENIKFQIGSVAATDYNKDMEVRGRDMATGLPRTINIRTEEIKMALNGPVQMIIQAARTVLEATPPELSSDLMEKGAVLTGGGAMLHGMDDLLADHLGIPITIAEKPMSTVVLGTGILLDNMDKLSAYKKGLFKSFHLSFGASKKITTY
ncbi:rod shape-determining protein MreB [Planococcus liqunii]|uniref:Cell shape-determining protein MreB n=1 Tax=Planococcus liqunii TaxID=3058394 RepID=A0ABT8MNR1_9BACL|nr:MULTISPECIES: rod shape-determining protein MreB [unclassified Planococcus (in: firmicutes)]MDN7226508.1 rod shape-determining protein MreB [Planococcus sp. N064]WKA50288.1 rod shape-determining protein MreB [Planococcus sp. N056]